MSIRQILIESKKDDLTILTTKSEAVYFESGEVPDNTINDLKDTLRVEPTGVGMAANQIGILKRIFVMKQGNKIKAFCNPRLTSRSITKISSKEGCLGRPGKETGIKRFKRLTLEWQVAPGKLRRKQYTGLLAIIIQHEMDHLNGVLI